MQSSHDMQGYALPTVVDPADYVCIPLRIPNDPAYIQAVLGALYDTTLWNSWQRDDAHTGLAAAQRMKLAWETAKGEIGVCTMPLQFRQPVPCTLEVSQDGGLTWQIIYEGYQCAYHAGQDAIHDNQANGTIPNNPQPSGQGSGTAAACYDYDVTLSGNQRWVFPYAVSENDGVTITNVGGAWSDGAGGIISTWRCADGNDYGLGRCTGSGQHLTTTDPAPTIYHMRLIALVNGANPVDAYNASFSIPTGIANGQLTLQANDDPLSDNNGAITFHVQVCKAGGRISWTIHQGSGPTDGVIGQAYTFNLLNPNDPDKGYNFWFSDVKTSDNVVHCVKFTVVSQSGWSPWYSGSQPDYWDGRDCNNVFFDPSTIAGNGNATSWPNTECISLIQFQSATQGTITIRFDELC